MDKWNIFYNQMLPVCFLSPHPTHCFFFICNIEAVVALWMQCKHIWVSKQCFLPKHTSPHWQVVELNCSYIKITKCYRWQNFTSLQDCSLFYTRRFCIPCVLKHVKEFPKEIQQVRVSSTEEYSLFLIYIFDSKLLHLLIFTAKNYNV